MSLPPFASVDDYADRFGAVADETRTEAHLADASAEIRSYLGASFVDDAGALDFSDAHSWAPDVFLKITCQVAHRTQTNPDGAQRETIDGYTVEHGGVYLNRIEQAQLNAATGRSPLGVLSTTRGPLETGDVRDRWFEGGLTEETEPWTLMPS